MLGRSVAVAAMVAGTAAGTGAVVEQGAAAAASPPTVTSLAPSSGPVGGDTLVQVNGSGFGSYTGTVTGSGTFSSTTFVSAVTGVSVGGVALTGTQYDVVSPGQIDLATPPVPAAPAAPVDVVVTTAAGASATSAADRFTYQASQPTCGASQLGAADDLCVAGTGGRFTMSIGGTPDTYGFGISALGNWDPGTGSEAFPASGIGLPQVLGTLGGVASPLTMTAAGPWAGGFDPTTQALSLTGTLTIGVYVPSTGDFCQWAQPVDLSGTVAVVAGSSTPTVTGTLTMSGTVDTATTDGANGCAVATSLLQGAALSITQPVTAVYDTPQGVVPPVVTGVSPSGGPAPAGQAVTITGNGFCSGATVSFGSLPATVQSLAPTQIQVLSPADPISGDTTQTVDVTVGGCAGGTSATSAADQYTFVGFGPPPMVQGVTPSAGPTTGGTVVSITGDGFGTTSIDPQGTSTFTPAVTGVTIGGVPVPAADVDVVSPDLLELVTPPGLPVGLQPVVVSVSSFGALGASGFTVYSTMPTCAGALSPTTNLCLSGSAATVDLATVPGGSGLAVTVPFSLLGTLDQATGATSVLATDATVGQASVTLSSGLPADVTTAVDGTATGTIDPAAGTAALTVPLAVGLYVPATGDRCLLHVTFGLTGTVTALGPPSPSGVVQATGTLASPPVTIGNGGGCTGGLLSGLELSGMHLPFTASVLLPTAAMPAVTSLFPASGPSSGYQVVFVFGKDLTQVTGVTFGGRRVLFKAYSSTLVMALRPPGLPGSVYVQVTTAAATTPQVSAALYTYDPPAPA